KGAKNANFVTPTHVLPALLEGLAIAADHEFSLPIVWNCGGYESVEALKLLDGIVSIYLPDAKYGDDAAAFELSGCTAYTAALRLRQRTLRVSTTFWSTGFRVDSARCGLRSSSVKRPHAPSSTAPSASRSPPECRCGCERRSPARTSRWCSQRSSSAVSPTEP